MNIRHFLELMYSRLITRVKGRCDIKQSEKLKNEIMPLSIALRRRQISEVLIMHT